MTADLATGLGAAGTAAGGAAAAGGAVAAGGAAAAGGGAAAATAGGGALLARAALQKIEPTPSEPIRFLYNPERITVKHSVQTKGVKGQSRAEQIMDLGEVEMAIDKVIFTGPMTKPTCDTLLSWSTTYVATVVKTGGPKQVTKAVGLLFSWGVEGLSYEVNLRTVSITYLRFTPYGTPTRAEVKLELHTALEKFLPPTNPTSGGQPGRRARVLDSSQCLPSLAATNYGRSSAWRGIAQANGIDDPLRVRPGTLLYLPEPDGPGYRELQERTP